MVLVLNEYMENQAYDRSEYRHDYRNRYYHRDYVLNIGRVELNVPGTRSGNFSTEVKEEFMNRYADEKKYQKALETLDESYEDTVQFFSEPTEAHVHIRTTNVLERLNGEVRKREKRYAYFQISNLHFA